MDLAELRTRAAEQSEARAEAFKNHLAEGREREHKENEKLQQLLTRAGEREKAKTKAAMETQVDIAIEQAKAKIKAEYAQKHGVTECDDQREPLKKLLGQFKGGRV